MERALFDDREIAERALFVWGTGVAADPETDTFDTQPLPSAEVTAMPCWAPGALEQSVQTADAIERWRSRREWEAEQAQRKHEQARRQAAARTVARQQAVAVAPPATEIASPPRTYPTWRAHPNDHGPRGYTRCCPSCGKYYTAGVGAVCSYG